MGIVVFSCLLVSGGLSLTFVVCFGSVWLAMLFELAVALLIS